MTVYCSIKLKIKLIFLFYYLCLFLQLKNHFLLTLSNISLFNLSSRLDPNVSQISSHLSLLDFLSSFTLSIVLWVMVVMVVAMGVDGSTVVVGNGGFMGLEWVIVGSWFCGWIDFGMGYGGFIVAKV